MKKLMYALSFLVMFFAFEMDASAASKKNVKEELSPEQKERLSEIEKRVDEIKEMDFSEMSKEERKEVKNELKDMKVEAKQMGGGIYLSVGAIIIIILLLILIL